MNLQSAMLYDRLRAHCTIYIANHSEVDCRDFNSEDAELLDDALTHLVQISNRLMGTCKHLDFSDSLTGSLCNDCGVEQEVRS